MQKNNLFHTNIITALGIERLPDDKKVLFLDKAAALVEQRIALRFMKRLDAASNKKFESLTGDERIAFLSRTFPDVEAVIEEEVMRIKAELMEDVNNDELLASLAADAE